MTIIACDGRYVAADGMKLWGNEIRSLNHKKLTVCEGYVLGYAGSAPMQNAVTSWYCNGADVEKLPKTFDPDTDWTLLRISRDLILKMSNKHPYPEEFEAPIAIGAGMDIATGMMWAGKSAVEAVEMVNARCNTSGGEIQIIDLYTL